MKEIQCATGDRRMNYKRRWTSPWYYALPAEARNLFDYMIDNYDKHKGEVFNVGLSDTNINKQQLVERIQKYIPNISVTYSDYYEDPDKRDYIVSNKKIESTGWEPEFTLDDGIKELIQAYQMIVPQESSHYRNAFPLSYGQSI